MSLPDSPVTVQEIKAGLVASQYTNAAAATIFLYDTLLTFNDEIELVWKRQILTFPTILYLCNRYMSLSAVVFMTFKTSPFHAPFSTSFCRISLGTLGFVIGAAAWSGIMALRTSALWRSNRIVVWGIWLSWVAFNCLMVVCGIMVYLRILPTMIYSSTFGVCISFTSSRILSASPSIEAGYVFIHTFLTAVRAYQFTSSSCRKTCTLINVLFMDGIGYFLVVASFSIAATLSSVFLPSARLYMFISLNWSVFSILISRLFLRLRKMFYVQEEDNYTDGVNVISLFPIRTDPNPPEERFQAQVLTDTEFGILSLPKMDPDPDTQSSLSQSQSLPTLPLPVLSLQGTVTSQTTFSSLPSTHSPSQCSSHALLISQFQSHSAETQNPHLNS